MADIPENALQAAAAAMEEHFDTGGDHLPGWLCCADAALEAAAPILAAQVRREVAEEFRAKAAHIRAIPDEGLNLGQIWHRHELASDYEQKADEIAARQIGEADAL